MGSNADGVQMTHHVSVNQQDKVRTADVIPTCTDTGAASCVIDNTLYVAGIGPARNELWTWNGDWTRREDMTSGRRHHSVAVVDSTLFALGGKASDDDAILGSVEAYSTKTSRWRAACALTDAACAAACVAYQNSIYLFGGRDASGREQARVQVYNAGSTLALQPPDMPTAKDGMKAVLWKAFAILIGQWSCLIYNFKTCTWQEVDWLRASMSSFDLILDNHRLYVAGVPVSGGDTDNNNEVKGEDTSQNGVEEMKSVCLFKVLELEQAAWKHHATLPQSFHTHIHGPVSLTVRAN